MHPMEVPMYRNFTRSLVALAAALVLSACEGPTDLDPTAEAMAALAGDYGATGELGALVFTTHEGGETIDWLDAGGKLEIRLTADGKTTGRLFVPGVDEDGGDMDEDLTGSWTLDGETIHFEHDADTFVRDMPFRVVGERLVGEASFTEVAVRVELARR
jgi:hypothetical protein